MLEPRNIPVETVDVALKQAQHYRLLNEPALAESICRDIIAVDQRHQPAWVTLLLALTDQFDEKRSTAFDQARDALEHLSDEFQRYYYGGIIYERWARAQLKSGLQHEVVDSWMRNAMSSYMMAEELAPPNDPNPLLRWNTCARFLKESEANQPAHAGSVTSIRDVQDEYGDDVPYR